MPFIGSALISLCFGIGFGLVFGETWHRICIKQFDMLDTFRVIGLALMTSAFITAWALL